MLKHTGLFVGGICFLGMIACGFVRIEKPIYTDSTQHVTVNKIPARITAESIELDAAVVAMGWEATEQYGSVVVEWQMPEEEAAWHQNSGAPGGGSNIVISGHNNSAGGRVFANVENLDIGDQITLRNMQGDMFHYEVKDKKLVRTLGASQQTLDFLEAVIKPTPSEQLTLITCWPSWSNTHRVIITAIPSPKS
jgi:LPXTG-site transpeptidase (sortase) family protein